MLDYYQLLNLTVSNYLISLESSLNKNWNTDCQYVNVLLFTIIYFQCLALQPTEGASFHTIVDFVFDFPGLHLACSF